MKSSTIFWGVFFIGLGALLLLNQFDVINADLSEIIRYWPVFLILIGVSLLNLSVIAKRIISGICGLFLALIIFSIITFKWSNICFWDCFDDVRISSNQYADSMASQEIITLDSGLTNAKLIIDGGATLLKFGGITNELMEMNPVRNLYGVNIIKTLENNTALIQFEIGPHSVKKEDSISRNAMIRLNPDIPWEIDMNIGASKIIADFSEYNIKAIDLDAGAASVEMKLGSKAEIAKLNIDGGAMSLVLELPKEVACRLEADSFLSSSKFDGFTKHDGVYLSDNYNNAKKKINIKIKGAFASYKILWY